MSPWCAGCGAAIDPGAAACRQCGMRPAGQPATPHAAVAETPGAGTRRRFLALASHPQAAAIAQETPPVPTAIGCALVGQILFGCLFAGFALFFIAVSQFAISHGALGIRLMFLVVPLIFLVVGGTTAVLGLRKWNRFQNAPTKPLSALVAAKRTQVSRGRRSSTTRYFVTLELQEGQRTEYEALGDVYGLCVEGDMGVAHVRDTMVLAFRKLDV